MAWFILFLAGVVEIGWAVGLKYTEGFTRPLPTILTAIAMIVSTVLLGYAVRTLPAATAYAIWTGIGTVGTAIVGMTLLGESVNVAQVVCLVLILCGVVGLKMASA